MDTYPDEKRKKAEFMMAVQSAAAAGQTLLLALHAEGISSVWTCGPLFAPDVIIDTLHLPKSWEPQAMFFIGFSTAPAKSKSVLPLDKISIWF
jgi:nitroreductase